MPKIVDKRIVTAHPKPLPASNSRAVYIGVDPGASGGLAVLQPSLSHVYVAPMPDTLRDLWEWFLDIGDQNDGEVFAVIEKVGGWTGGRAGYEGNQAPGSAMFKFGQSYGTLIMALTAADIPYEEVTPQTWQKALGIPPRKKKPLESKVAFKNRLKGAAQKIYPKVKVTLATADALLLATFCQRKREGKL